MTCESLTLSDIFLNIHHIKQWILWVRAYLLKVIEFGSNGFLVSEKKSISFIAHFYHIFVFTVVLSEFSFI